MTEQQLQELSRLWDQHMDAMKRFLATGKKAELDGAERLAAEMRTLREGDQPAPLTS